MHAHSRLAAHGAPPLPASPLHSWARWSAPPATPPRSFLVCPQITGPLIRIIGDRFPWQIKAAILKTLGLLIRCVWARCLKAPRDLGLTIQCWLPSWRVQLLSKPYSATVFTRQWQGRPGPRACQNWKPSQAERYVVCPPLPCVCSKAGAGLKPFVPQLQTTFVKCLSDPQKEVWLVLHFGWRSVALIALN